jgi:tetratricopeptide (TPR) repeat protein
MCHVIAVQTRHFSDDSGRARRSSFFPVAAWCVLACAFSERSFAQQIVPTSASEVKTRVDQQLSEAAAKYERESAEAQQVYERKSEFNHRVRDATAHYREALNNLRQKALDANDQPQAAALQALINDPPGLAQQQHWLDSFTAESVLDYPAAVAALESMPSPSDVGLETFRQLRLGWLQYLQKDYPTAITAYQKAAALSPQATSPLTGLIYSHVAVQDQAAVISTCQELLAIDPCDRLALKSIADAHYQSEAYSEAAKYYGKLVELSPEDLDAASNLAWSWLRSGKRTEAHKKFAMILQVSPAHVMANLGYRASLLGP